MPEVSSNQLAALIVNLVHRVAILEGAEQLPFSTIDANGAAITLGDVAEAASSSAVLSPALTALLAANSDAVAAAGLVADAAAEAGAEAGALGLAAGAAAQIAAADAVEKAQTASDNADAALEAAQRAETSADGANANTYSTSAPPSPDPDAATRRDGDSWYIITSAGNLTGIYRWDAQSSAWVQGILTGGAVGNLDAGVIVSGYIAAARIAANTITSAMIQADAITAREIAAATITSAEIAAQTILAANIAGNTITAAQIAANTITAAQIAAGTIGADQIAANAITANKIAANAVTATQIAAGAIDGITITGALFRTAASGKRTESNSTGFTFYDANNNAISSLSADGLVLAGGTKLQPYGNGIKILAVPGEVAGDQSEYSLTVGYGAGGMAATRTGGAIKGGFSVDTLFLTSQIYGTTDGAGHGGLNPSGTVVDYATHRGAFLEFNTGTRQTYGGSGWLQLNSQTLVPGTSPAGVDTNSFTWQAGPLVCIDGGLYLIAAAMRIVGAAGNRGIQITKNSTSVDTTATLGKIEETGLGTTIMFPARLAAGDTLRMFVEGSASGTVGANYGDTYFRVVRLTA